LEFWRNRFTSLTISQKITLGINNKKEVGFSCLHLDYDPFYGNLLDNLHVLQQFQNLGIGTLLIKNCVQTILKKSKTLKMHLWVYEANHNARKVYQHLGGIHAYTSKKIIEDGTEAKVCKYVWEDVSILS